MPIGTTPAYETAPLDELLALLLKQFRRPLLTRGLRFSDADAEDIARAAVAHTPPDDRAVAVRTTIAALVTESEAVLGRWNLDLAQSLETSMDAIPGWETTAEFLDLANEKSNAELRISTGSAVLVALGDARYRSRLAMLAARPPDLDTVIARRVLEAFPEGT